MPSSRWRRKVEVFSVATTRTKFSRKQPHEGKFCPLTNPEGLKQLLTGVFDGEGNRVGCGNWQHPPQVREDVQQQGTNNLPANQIRRLPQGVTAVRIPRAGSKAATDHRAKKQEASPSLLDPGDNLVAEAFHLGLFLEHRV